MAEAPVLEATRRAVGGKGAVRAVRRSGMVPCIIYGGETAPSPIAIPDNELRKALNRGRFLSTLIDLRIDGKANRVIAREVQRDVVMDTPIHVDFLRMTESARINLMIPVLFENEAESPGLKRGGVLNVVRHEVEMTVRAGDIPESLSVDLTGLDIGDVVHISMVTLPKGAVPVISDRDFAVATIAAPSVLLGAGEAAQEAGEEAQEGAGEEEGDRDEG